jgi:peptidoglycan-N-acetylglucosamine deacetylase
MYLVKIPSIAPKCAPHLLWHTERNTSTLHLTFDDGPHLSITPEVLDLLNSYQAKATFFCLGKNAEAHPQLMERLRKEGHTIGNHGYSHLNGWYTPTTAYIKNALKANELLRTSLFRPPYGRITPAQVRLLKKRFRIVMWDVISGDFDRSISAEKCTQNVITHATQGSIVVFHDSEKAHQRMIPALEATLRHFSEQGYTFTGL